MAHTPTIIDGIEYPSVTEIINILSKPGLNKWREWKGTKEADKISKEAADRGKKAHGLVEQFLKGETIVFCGEDTELRPIFKAWFDWWRETKYHCLNQEVKVISKKYMYGGTFDAIITKCRISLDANDYILVDWKFSNNDDKFRWLQLAGYAQAYYEQTKDKIKKGMIVRVDKKAKIHVSEVKNLWIYVPLFIACRKLYDFINSLGKFKKK